MYNVLVYNQELSICRCILIAVYSQPLKSNYKSVSMRSIWDYIRHAYKFLVYDTHYITDSRLISSDVTVFF